MSGRNREFDENKALQNAADVFWIKGYEAASTEDLLQAMCINKGSMYNAFGNKRSLFIKVTQWFSDRFLENMKAVFQKHEDPKEAIKTIFFGIARATDPTMHAKGCYYVNILGEMSGMDEELAKLAQQKLLDVESVFYKEVKKGIEKGWFSRDADPKLMAKYLVNLWNGLNISRRMYSRKDLEQLIRMNLKTIHIT